MKKYYDTTITKENLEILTWINRAKFPQDFVKAFKKILFMVGNGFFTEKEAFEEAVSCSLLFQKKGILGLYQDTLCMGEGQDRGYIQEAIVIYINNKNVEFDPEAWKTEK